MSLVIDPGGWTEPEAVEGATAVLITHQHPDHYQVDHLRAAEAPVFTILAVAELIRVDAPDLAERLTVVAPRQEFDAGLPVRAIGDLHAVIHPGPGSRANRLCELEPSRRQRPYRLRPANDASSSEAAPPCEWCRVRKRGMGAPPLGTGRVCRVPRGSRAVRRPGYTAVCAVPRLVCQETVTPSASRAENHSPASA